MKKPSQLQIFVSPFKDEEIWESALFRFLPWDYGEAGYQMGLEIEKRNFSAIWVKIMNLQRQGVDWLEGIMTEAV